MQMSIRTEHVVSLRRLAPALLLLGLVCGSAHKGWAQTACTTAPLCFSKNYIVTGDYTFGGVGLRGLGDATGFATGIINIPDTTQPNSNPLPDGAQILAAYLYWQTVEKSSSAFAGASGFFNGYAITGTQLGNPNAPVSWSAGGCAGASNGTTTLRTYRADVRPYLNLSTTTGNALGNGSYQVRLADSGSNGGGVPLTLGATLVIVYRVLSPTKPLNAIVIYDGAFAPSNSSQTMSQDLQGFYQTSVSATPVAKLTHIVGNGQTNKSEQVSLGGLPLPSLYPGLPPFPGFYNGSWDNPTWSDVNQFAQPHPNGTLLVKGNASLENTSVQPAATNSGCVSWAAIVFSTTVQDSDNDGLLDIWETNQGYVDFGTTQWVALPGADPNARDIFVEIDWLNNLDLGASTYKHSHLPKQAALDKVGDAFKNAPPVCTNVVCKGVKVHFDVGPSIYVGDPYVIDYGTLPPPPKGATTFPGAGGNSIPESAAVCNDNPTTTTLCEFPSLATTGWKAGFLSVKDSPSPLGNFQLARAQSYHYVLFGHALGMPRSYWSTFGGSTALASITNITKLDSIMVQAGNTAVVTIESPAGVLKPGDTVAATDPAFNDLNLDRVSVRGAIGQPALNGTYIFTNPPSKTSTDQTTNVTTTVFTISPVTAPIGTYTYSNEPQMGLGYGGPSSSSGHSDLGGADSAVMFGLWPADDTPGCLPDPSLVPAGQTSSYCDNQVGNVTNQAGTLMHEIGHSLTLTHGGAYYTNPLKPSLASYGLNCKPNFLSVMNYLFQVRGFPVDLAIDYSGQVLTDLNESVPALNGLSETFGVGDGTGMPPAPIAVHPTRWFAPPNAFDIQQGGRLATRHCDGSPLGPNESAVRVDGATVSNPIDWNNNLIVPDTVNTPGVDVNFNGKIADLPFAGFNDWKNFDLRQVSARANVFGFSVAGIGTEGGGIGTEGGGIGTEGGGIGTEGGGIGTEGGGIGTEGGGIGTEGGGVHGPEVDFGLANSTVDAPTGLTATLSKALKAVVLNWNRPPFGQIRSYTVYRLLGTFNPVTNPLKNAVQLKPNVTGTPPPTTFNDTTAKNNTTYTYFVTAALGDGRQSGPSNLFTIFVKFQ